MRFVAHPLVVAAALGLLSPLALADDEVEPEARAWCAEGDAPSEEELRRIAEAFEAARP